MKHGKTCNCPVCKVGKAMGMIEKEEKKSEHGESCASGNCSVEHGEKKSGHGDSCKSGNCSVEHKNE